MTIIEKDSPEKKNSIDTFSQNKKKLWFCDKNSNIVSEPLFSKSKIKQNAFIFLQGIGKPCLIYNISTIVHKYKRGGFVNICPLCSIIRLYIIGTETYLDANSVLLPNVKIDKCIF